MIMACIVIYIKYALVGIGLYLAIRFLFSKRSVFYIDRLSKAQKEFALKHGKKVNTICRIIIVIMLVFVLPMYFIPLTLDIPYALTQNINNVKVEAISFDKGNSKKTVLRNIRIKEIETGKEYEIHVNYTMIEKGDKFIISVLPFSKQGVVDEKLDMI